MSPRFDMFDNLLPRRREAQQHMFLPQRIRSPYSYHKDTKGTRSTLDFASTVHPALCTDVSCMRPNGNVLVWIHTVVFTVTASALLA